MRVLATVLKCFYGLLWSFGQRSMEALQEERDIRWYQILTPDPCRKKLSAVITIQSPSNYCPEPKRKSCALLTLFQPYKFGIMSDT